jgi:anti-sigma factor RsiW
MTAPATPCYDASAERRLNLFLDGELPSAEDAALFGHLAACADCRAQLSALMAFRRVIREEPLVVPPAADEGFLARLADARDAERLYAPYPPERLPVPLPARPTRRLSTAVLTRRRVPMSAAAFAACVLFVLGLLAGTPREVPMGPVLPGPDLARISSGVVETVADDGGVVYLITPGVTVQSGANPTRPLDGPMQ